MSKIKISPKKLHFSLLTFITLILCIFSISFGTINAFAGPNWTFLTQENENTLSQLLNTGEIGDYLQTIKSSSASSTTSNPLQSGQTKSIPDDFLLAGEIDTSFGINGRVVTSIGASSQANGTVIQSDGKIVVAGTSSGNPDSGFALVRYDTNGTLDATFGTGGKVFTAIGSTGQSFAVALQADGKIVAAGFAGNGANNDFAVARYNTNGTLDTTFDNDGVVIVPIGSANDEAYAVAVQTDGRIVVAGQSNNGTNDQIALVRLNNNGSLDNTFDGDGKVTTPVTSGSEYAFAIRLQPDGKIVTGGVSGNPNIDFLLARFNTTGALDTAFGTNGKVFTDFGKNDYATAMALSADGKIVAVGFSEETNGANHHVAIARYSSNGFLDTSFGFGNTGKLVFNNSNLRDDAFAVFVQPSGSIIIGGSATVDGNQGFFTARISFDGLSISNRSTYDLGPMEDGIRAFAIQPNGYIVAAGYKQISSQIYNFAVVRYVFDTGTGCSTAASPSMINVGATGGIYSFVVTTSSSQCGYQLFENGSFFQISSGRAKIAGGGTVVVNVSNNQGPARSGNIGGVGTNNFNISQASGCIFTLSAATATHPSNAGGGSFNITASNPSCTYTAVSNDSFIAITSTANGTISYSLTANTGTERTGTITVAGRIFTITQASGCTYSLSPTSASVLGNAGTGTFGMTSGAGCTWTAISNNPFITITSGSTGSGSGTVSYAVTANTTGTNRTGTITAGGQTFTITQAALPVLTINNVTLNEGDSGTTAFTFTVSLSAALGQSVSVNYATANGTATAGEDYTAASGTITFAPGEVNKTLTVSVIGDTEVEGNETFTVNLSGAANATISNGQGPGTILNDDTGGSLQFSLSNYTVNENEATAAITVTRTGGAAGGVSINYATANGTAMAGQDYTAASGTLNFGANEMSKTFTIPIINDSINEPTETLNISLSNPAGGGTLGTPATAVLTIIDDDGAPTLSIGNVSANEGNTGTTAFTFTVSLLGASSQTVTVNYATANGTATSPGDFTATSGSLSFAPGETSKTVTVAVNGDTEVEPNETFTVTLSGAANATIANAQGTATILNDDTGGSIQFSLLNYTVNENAGTVTITVTRTGGAASGVSINYSTSDGTATAGQDYNAAAGTLTFAANETTKSFTVPIINDSINEQNETVNLTLTNAVGGTLGSPATAVLTIIDDDGAPTLSIGNVSLNEGNTGTTAFTFTVSLLGASSQTVTVNYATANGTAISPGDYTATSGSLSFAPGETSKTVIVQVNGDTEVEPNETFTVNLTNAANATIASGVGTGTIQNDDICAYSISPTSIITAAGGGTGTIALVTQAGCAYTAVSNDSWITITSGSSGTGNGTITFTVAANTGAARTGTILVAGQTFTVNQSAGTTTTTRTLFDFDGDGKSDISVFRPSNGVWYLNQSQNGFAGITFGQNGDLIAPADFDGDGKTDVAVFRPANGTWYYLKSSDNSFVGVQFGANGDLPRPADFDGDGKADISLFRPSNGAWYRLNSADGSFYGNIFGQNGDKPLAADYDGDGKSDLAVFRPSTNTFYWLASANNGFNAAQFGLSTDIPTPGDFDGDGKTDIAVFRPSNGSWYRINSSNGSFAGVQFGASGDIPTTGDYDGDGKSDIAVFRPTNGSWYYTNSSNGGFVGTSFGVSTDKPVPAAFQN